MDMELDNGIRVDLLRQLAEQAMTDPDFRAVARDDLAGALAQYGYDLNEQEMELVLRFRASLEEAGIDLFLLENLPGSYGELIKSFAPSD
jgi:hypothetical protein